MSELRFKPCMLRMCDSSAQPESSLRCMTCGDWRGSDGKCFAGGIYEKAPPLPPADPRDTLLRQALEAMEAYSDSESRPRIRNSAAAIRKHLGEA